MQEGLFEFSKVQPKIKDLKKWEKWFESKGIRTEVINRKGFILCREGVDAFEADRHKSRKK